MSYMLCNKYRGSDVVLGDVNNMLCMYQKNKETKTKNHKLERKGRQEKSRLVQLTWAVKFVLNIEKLVLCEWKGLWFRSRIPKDYVLHWGLKLLVVTLKGKLKVIFLVSNNRFIEIGNLVRLGLDESKQLLVFVRLVLLVLCMLFILY